MDAARMHNIALYGCPDPFFGTNFPASPSLCALLDMIKSEPDDGVNYEWFEKTETPRDRRRRQLARKLPGFLQRHWAPWIESFGVHKYSRTREYPYVEPKHAKTVRRAILGLTK